MSIESNRKLHSLREAYMITVDAFRTMSQFRQAKKNGEIDLQLTERIMLAVTEVNGCMICSYAHCKIALEAGLSNTEIQNMLAGINDDLSAEELQAIIFAQHYADSRGKPTKAAWERIGETYGLSKAKGILGAIRMIMMGNVYGIPWSAFVSRLKGKPDKRSSIHYELGLMITSTLFLPFAIIHASISKLLGRAIIEF
jgi:AhpD family alkylhydroperoxidase